MKSELTLIDLNYKKILPIQVTIPSLCDNKPKKLFEQICVITLEAIK